MTECIVSLTDSVNEIVLNLSDKQQIQVFMLNKGLVYSGPVNELLSIDKLFDVTYFGTPLNKYISRLNDEYYAKYINRDRNITLDKFSGKDALAYRLDSMQIKYSPDQLNQILGVIKSDATKSSFNDIELIEIADEILEVDLKPYIPGNVEAIINMELSSTVYTTRITRWLMSQSQVEDVYEVAGDFDIIAHVQSNSIGELNSLIEELRLKEGISRTHTRPILKEYSKSKLKKDQ